MEIKLRPAYDELDAVRQLFREYEEMLGIDLSFQDFAHELQALPGKFSLPEGRLYLADYGGDIAGCAALRPTGGGDCEMKRLYVRPRFRTLGLGGILTRKVISDAREMGYRKMYLDTFDYLEAAVSMYRKYGFEEVEPYYENPFENVVYFCLKL